MLTPDSCDQKYLDAVTAVYGANGQPDASTIRQNADASTTSERVVGNIERFALLDALTRAEDHGTVLIDVDGHGPGAIVTAVFQIPLGSVNITDAATLMAMASGFELVEHPAGPPRKAGLIYGSDHLAPPSPTDIFRELNARETQVLKC
ncbi:MAG TPA: hypothetical protein VEZ26_00230, partial [Sphingomonadaceae bacterium]|nr:hypothetical protein [Sphingomonadaceae bacterium]